MFRGPHEVHREGNKRGKREVEVYSFLGLRDKNMYGYLRTINSIEFSDSYV
jgi:hypothetical protein